MSLTVKQFYEKFISGYYTDANLPEYIRDTRCLLGVSLKDQNKVIDSIKGKTKDYCYMVNFTLNPQKVELNEDTYGKVEKYIKKLLRSKTLSLTNAFLVREGGDNTDKHVHWHASIKSDHFIKKDRFNYYQKKYGNDKPINMSKSNSGTQENSLEYMSKQNEYERIL